MSSAAREPRAARIQRVLRRLRRAYAGLGPPDSSDPLAVLIGCVISLRTRDQVTYPATERLLSRGPTAEALARMRESTIAKLIYPAGFYRRKAMLIRRIAKELVANHGGRVPSTLDELLELPGVGPKTANLVRGAAFGKPAIAVDTHVHRISNRLGWVKTDRPAATQAALERILPRRSWRGLNNLLVQHGKAICAPRSPICSQCAVESDCRKRNVGSAR